MAIIDIINIIDRLESLIDTSKNVPMGTSLMVDKKRVMELVDQLRLSIPEEIRAAEEVLAQKDQILGTAQTDARRAKAMAEDEFRDRLNNNELVAQAEQRAAQMTREAEERAARMLHQAETESQARRTDADAYALRSLRALETQLAEVLGSVRKGVEVLAGQASTNLNSQYFGELETMASAPETPRASRYP